MVATRMCPSYFGLMTPQGAAAVLPAPPLSLVKSTRVFWSILCLRKAFKILPVLESISETKALMASPSALANLEGETMWGEERPSGT